MIGERFAAYELGGGRSGGGWILTQKRPAPGIREPAGAQMERRLTAGVPASGRPGGSHLRIYAMNVTA